MGIDISHIVRHDFCELDDYEKSYAYCKKVRDSLWSNLLLDSHIDRENEGREHVYYPGDDMGFEIRIPYHDIELDLRSGCWDIEPFYHYVQLVLGKSARRLAFDIVHALGQSEAWHAAEYNTWNGGPMENPKCSIQEWFDFVKEKYGEDIPEFDYSCIGQRDDEDKLDYCALYHDSFEECLAEYNQLQNKTNKYRLIGLSRVGYNMLRAEKDGELYLLYENNMSPVLHYPVRTEYTFFSPWIVVWNGDKSAVIDATGDELTPFVKGGFEIKREKTDVQHNGEKYKRLLIYAENVEAKMKIVLEEKYAPWYKL